MLVPGRLGSESKSSYLRNDYTIIFVLDMGSTLVLITHFDDQGHRCYDHIAYVAGFNDDGSVDLIESNTDEHNNVASVRHTTLNNSYVWAIELSGIAY